MALAITLPQELQTRHTVRRFLPTERAGEDVVLDASAVARYSAPAVDELVKGLLAIDAQHVIVVNATPALQRALTVVHRARTRPERTFLLTFREVAAEALLRPV